MKNIPGAVGLVAVVLLAARLAQAGIADTPLPVLTLGVMGGGSHDFHPVNGSLGR